MAIDIVYVIVIVLLVAAAIIILWFIKSPKVKIRKSKKHAKKPMKPFHPEVLTGYKIKERQVTFKGNSKTYEERKQEQMEKDRRD
jgi:flagellar basal body-associated protein FliL